MRRSTIAELIVALEPEMRELIALREEVVRLRFKQNPPTPTVTELMADLPITTKRDDDGKWSATIDLGPGCARTGVSGVETDVEAFRHAVRHLAKLLGEEWSREDDDA